MQRRPEVPSRARKPLTIRVSDSERRILEAAAAVRPEYVSTWIREVALAAARDELGRGPAEA